MKNIILLPAALCLAFASASAQDIIVRHDDSTIVAKVKKIGTSEIEYVKFGNQDGPIYAIAKKDVKCINYENGSRDTFTDAAPASEAVSATAAAPSARNASLVAAFNQGDIRYTGNKTDKDADFLLFQFKLTPESVLENDDPTVEIEPVKFREEGGQRVPYKTSHKLGGWSSNDGYWFSLMPVLTNRTDKDIYVDLGSSNIIRNGVASSLYQQTVSSSTESSTVGGGVGTSVLGIGVGVGGAKTSTNTTTVFAKRIIQIPPHSKIQLPYMELGKPFMESAGAIISSYLKDVKHYEVKGRNMGTMSAIGLKNGEAVDMKEAPNPLSVAFRLNYGFSESGPFNRSIASSLLLDRIIGTEDYKGILKFDTTEFPESGFYFYVLNYFGKKTLRK